MGFRTILVLGFVFGVTGCTEREQVSTGPAGNAAMSEPDIAAATVVDEVWRDETFMAVVAVEDLERLGTEKLDDLNFALADEDLEAAKAAADWLATHDTDSNIQSDWMPYLYRMRTEAEAVATATDISAAQSAAQRMTVLCQECHAAAGINAQLNR